MDFGGVPNSTYNIPIFYPYLLLPFWLSYSLKHLLVLAAISLFGVCLSHLNVTSMRTGTLSPGGLPHSRSE